ncbi:N-acetylmuramoyl-L-alanine amidase domain protein [Synechococcus sp. PCC 7335]|uniref:peptidoglycan recognition protein family protein n=1 Tax=Synechococcus sp. (strain ATCC 29403 / PCC 7335) TaxID=91464 RepID=UPI00017EDD3A|nr:peptidoglycan recognition family protein [Synechococcus sp. PCC 7335]EDX86326.1 N-acetylmuramoyl-L-alanine amidase domain protein [Synechococcus sp. PCC 7335]
MRRSWLVWAASTVAFVLTVLIVVSTGSLSDTSSVSSQSHNPSMFSARAENTITEEGSKYEIAANKLVRQPTTGSRSRSNHAQKTPTQTAPGDNSSSQASLSTSAATSYQPKEVLQLADPSNYGERFTVDVNGTPVSNDFIVVLHETVGSASSALNLFARHHPRDEDQVSYHSLISLDGTIYYVVPPEQRAFGAGNSSFRTTAGEETVTTNPGFPSSVNNFAYHISLETPPDGQNNSYSKHSGYTEAQYQSLAWLLARTTVPDYRITTHKAVDRSGSRSDPRSYDPTRLYALLHQYPSRTAYSY